MFAHLTLDTACQFFLPPFSFQIRVGGLYLLYSLYGCQTATPPEQVGSTGDALALCAVQPCLTQISVFTCLWLQIRLALKDWESVKRFEKDAIDAQHLDVIYILHKLMWCKAFHFTAMPSLVSCHIYTSDSAVLLIFRYVYCKTC